MLGLRCLWTAEVQGDRARETAVLAFPSGLHFERPVLSVNSFSFFWFFSVTLSMRQLLTAFSSERGLQGWRVRLSPGRDG
jgi:hypothetical protein